MIRGRLRSIPVNPGQSSGLFLFHGRLVQLTRSPCVLVDNIFVRDTRKDCIFTLLEYKNDCIFILDEENDNKNNKI